MSPTTLTDSIALATFDASASESDGVQRVEAIVITPLTTSNPPSPQSNSGQPPRRVVRNEAKRDPRWLELLAIATTYLILGSLLILPAGMIFYEAFKQGWTTYVAAFVDRHALHAIWLTLLATMISIPMNMVFGVAAAWAITKFQFRGKNLLIALIDLPFAVSPVISGLVFILLFGANGWFGEVLDAWGFKVVFAVPGIILATLFVTFPFVARELIPLMSEQGTEEEQAALSLGAGGLQTFIRITLPNIRWGLLYGVILSTARAIGEFGAVSVVSGHIRGQTNTLPLHIEILYADYNSAAAFAIASALALLGLVTLALKAILEHRLQKQKREFGSTAGDSA